MMEKKEQTEKIQKIKEIIHRRLKENGRMKLAIDGMAASGKSTLACKLAEELGGEVIHMDDFFLPMDLRTAERLEEPGGNVHYERFSAEVAGCLRNEESFDYGVFSCRQMAVLEKRHISNNGFVIVEGAYSLRPEFRDIYNFKIFMTVERDVQQQRILNRNGASGLTVFNQRWIPLEEKYFNELKPDKAADMII